MMTVIKKEVLMKCMIALVTLVISLLCSCTTVQTVHETVVTDAQPLLEENPLLNDDEYPH